MVFNSLTFVVFLAIVLLLYQLSPTWRLQKLVLLVASYLFYAAWNPPFVLLLMMSTTIDWLLGWAMARAEGSRRKQLLVISLLVNLGVLGYFKYAGFLLSSFQDAAGALGVIYQAPDLDIVLPVGISFYTFQSLSYTLDVYRGEVKPWRSFVDFATFVAFFPQLVAGPIIRADHFEEQLVERKRITGHQLVAGTTLLIVGLFQKVVVADALLAGPADEVYRHAATATFTDAWAGTFAFAGQIYCDFAGYTTCAVGVAMMMGFWLPPNFNAPYAAIGFSDFWRRWHISLSTWLRDYLYISLGGNRGGQLLRYRNLLITMLLGGLWHGASWHFVVWGGLHGVYLVIEQLLRRAFPERVLSTGEQLVGVLLTFLAVCITWVFFRASSIGDAWILVKSMLGAGGIGGPSVLSTVEVGLVLPVVAALLTTHWLVRKEPFAVQLDRWSWPRRGMVLGVALLLVVLAPGGDRAFIYFQF